jgi:hypothetical protein
VAVGRSSRAGVAAVLLVVIVIAVFAITRMRHYVSQAGSGCLVRGRSFEVPLSPSQAGIAATIAGVAMHRTLPARAVTIAYATALQESDLQNLTYGDRDSIGVFQQRPSQGWGTRSELLDPVYSSGKFFAALIAVPGYQSMRVYQAAQAVQRSADGFAYNQYAPEGAILADGFTGRQPRAVWCWYSGSAAGTGRRRLTAAARELARVYGPLRIGHAADPASTVAVGTGPAGWSVASWLITNASEYGITFVRYRGYQWRAADGQQGWTRYVGTGHHRTAARLTVGYG